MWWSQRRSVYTRHASFVSKPIVIIMKLSKTRSGKRRLRSSGIMAIGVFDDQEKNEKSSGWASYCFRWARGGYPKNLQKSIALENKNPDPAGYRYEPFNDYYLLKQTITWLNDLSHRSAFFKCKELCGLSRCARNPLKILLLGISAGIDITGGCC